MELITAYALDSLTLDELHALYYRLQQELAQTDRGTADRRNCLASIENVCRAIHQRISAPRCRGPGL